MALRGVSLYHETNCSWDDVGGLKNVKEILIEMLEWPTQVSYQINFQFCIYIKIFNKL